MGLWIDAVLVLLLAAMMGYGVYITRRLRRLMAVLTEMEPLVREFSAAVDKSEQSVSRMKRAAQDLTSAPAAVAAAAPAQAPAAEGAVTFSSRRRKPRAAAATGPIAGMTRVTGKADLVRSFFERGRMQGEVAQQW
ncbi:flagellar motor switch protein [Acidimangrovimonas pyrenivorans]|uniref:Flagellar motor switch protein n=1 Tax=Acidimangrovimonas pyrenivorans TaxID=2030798 RepID=A0ABV7AMR9_9RHOB